MAFFAVLFVAAGAAAKSEKLPRIDGVVRDGVVFVPVADLVARFGASMNWSGDVRKLLVLDQERQFTISLKHSATIIDGRPYAALPLLEWNLALTAEKDPATGAITLTRDAVKVVVRPRKPSTTPKPAPKTISLPVHRYTPPQRDAKVAKVEIDPKKTALLVIDFWDLAVAPPEYFDNTASLIFLARRHGIPVIHLPHEGLGIYGMNPRVLPIPDDEPVLSNALLERYFVEKGMSIDTLLFAGYATSECVLFTRSNSINQLATRAPDRFRMILMKDATSAPYWTYRFTVNGIETRFMSSTVDDLAQGLGEPKIARAVPRQDQDVPSSYRIDERFGAGLDARHTALVIVNAWDGDDDDPQWGERVRKNTAENIIPLLRYARAAGLKVIHVPNGRPIAAAARPAEGEAELATMDEIRTYLAEQEIRTVVYAGNLINTTPLFPPIDLLGFTMDLSPTVKSRYLEDCLIVFEPADSLPGENFKKVFLERVTAVSPVHEVSSFAILQRNDDVSAAE